MTSSTKPSVALSKVPPVKELCDLLGFQYASPKETTAFIMETRAWRRLFITGSGRPATDLLHWNQESDQLDLEEMAQSFLDFNKNGARFWSPERAWKQDDGLKFPDDRATITALLKQLFWKQNRYAHNNSLYSQKATESHDSSRESTAAVRQTAHDLPSATIRVEKSMPTNSTLDQAKLMSTNHLLAQDREQITTDISMTASNGGKGNTTEATRYFGTGTENDGDTNPTNHSPGGTNIGHHTGQTPQRKKRKHNAKVSPRKSDRKRVARTIPDSVQTDKIEELIVLTDDDDNTSPTPHVYPGWSHLKSDMINNTSSSRPSNSEKRFAPTAPMLSQGGKQETNFPQATATKIAPATLRFEVNRQMTNATTPIAASPQNTPVVAALDTKKRITKGRINTSPRVKDPTESTLVSRATQQASVQNSSIPSVRPPSTALGPPVHVLAVQDKESEPGEIAAELPQAVQLGSSSASEPNCMAEPIWTYPQSQTRRVDALQSGCTEHGMSCQDCARSKGFRRGEAMVIDGAEYPRTSLPTAKQALKDQSLDHSSFKEASITETSKPRQRTQVPIWIITRKPRYTEERWEEGRLAGTTLTDFIRGVSAVTERDRIEKLKLTLHSAAFDIKVTIPKHANESWSSAKEAFMEKLREVRAEAKLYKQSDPISVKILVEPCYEEVVIPIDDMDDDDEDWDM